MSSEWKTYRVEHIAAEMGDAPFGSNLKNDDYTESGALVVRGTNIQGRHCDWSDRRYVSLEKYKQLAKNHCFAGDIVFPKVGTIGKVGLVTEAAGIKHYVLSTNTMRLKVNTYVACPDFVYYYFTWPKTSALINAFNSKSVQPVFNYTSLRNFIINLPPVVEQRRISSILKSLDDRITILRETSTTLESIAQALFKSWFVDFAPVRAKQEGREPEGMDADTAAVFPNSFEESELGLVPKGWQILPVGDAVECVGGGTPNTKYSDFWEPAEFAWATPKDLSGMKSPVLLKTERLLSAKGVSKVSSGLLPTGTLLLSSRAPIGYLAITQIPLAINQGYIAILPSSQLPPLYMLFWCQLNMETIKSRSNGSTFMEISKKAFRPIPAIVPPTQVLKAYFDVAGPVFNRLVDNEKQAQTITNIRDALLPRLISGQLRLPDAEEMGEEAAA